ncbi:MAG: ABC transporter permease [Microbacterium sp.]
MSITETQTLVTATNTRVRGAQPALIALGSILIAIIVLTFLVPALGILPPPHEQDFRATLLPPAWLPGGTWEHVLGTDQLGRDMLSRIIAGGRLTFIIALAGLLAGAIPGVTLGLLAGYFRGTTDIVVSRLIEAQLALPYILLALSIITGLGNSIPALVFVLALVGWAQYARVLRAEVFSLRDRAFVRALRVAGVPTARIIFRHILSNVMGTVIVLATVQVAMMILAESALSFLGLGVVPPEISWGSLLADGREFLTTAWWIAAFPGLALTIVAILVNLFGDELRVRLDPRKRRY